jgi:F0F1-type ATP synthase membrane subunit b/b'
MDILNQTLNSFSGQISDLSVSLNLDIFETNVINISILLGGIIYLGSNALSESLSERQQKIVGNSRS